MVIYYLIDENVGIRGSPEPNSVFFREQWFSIHEFSVLTDLVEHNCYEYQKSTV